MHSKILWKSYFGNEVYRYNIFPENWNSTFIPTNNVEGLSFFPLLFFTGCNPKYMFKGKIVRASSVDFPI